MLNETNQKKKQTNFFTELYKSLIITSCKVHSKMEMTEAIVHTASERKTHEDYLITMDLGLLYLYIPFNCPLNNHISSVIWAERQIQVTQN